MKKLKSLKDMLMETGIHIVFKIFEKSKGMEVYFYWSSWLRTSSRRRIKNFHKFFGNAAYNYKVNHHLCLNHISKTFNESRNFKQTRSFQVIPLILAQCFWFLMTKSFLRLKIHNVRSYAMYYWTTLVTFLDNRWYR